MAFQDIALACPESAPTRKRPPSSVGQDRISSALVTNKKTPPITEGKCSHFGNGPDHSVKTEIVAKTLALCTPMPNRIWRQSYGRARKSGFITWPGKGEKQEASASRTVLPVLVSREGYIVRREIVIKIKTVPGGTSGKESACQRRRPKICGFDPRVGKILWRGHGNPLQYSCLENCMDRGA